MRESETVEIPICGCGPGPESATVVLREYLAVFCLRGEDPGFVDPALYQAFEAKYGEGVTHLLSGFMEQLEFTEHSGSVGASSWLTPRGQALKAQLDEEEDHAG